MHSPSCRVSRNCASAADASPISAALRMAKSSLASTVPLLSTSNSSKICGDKRPPCARQTTTGQTDEYTKADAGTSTNVFQMAHLRCIPLSLCHERHKREINEWRASARAARWLSLGLCSVFTTSAFAASQSSLALRVLISARGLTVFDVVRAQPVVVVDGPGFRRTSSAHVRVLL